MAEKNELNELSDVKKAMVQYRKLVADKPDALAGLGVTDLLASAILTLAKKVEALESRIKNK